MMPEFSETERHELLRLVRETIRRHLETGKAPTDYPPTPNPKLREKRGVFVTLHRHGELRGCIGYPLPYKPLIQAVVDNAVAAAFEDPRFSPLSPGEFSELEIEISVLTLPRPVASPEEVQVGRDGIIVSKGINRGLLLPQVPVEQGWDLEAYLSYGCLKAGLPRDEWKKGVKIEVFQAEVFGEEGSGGMATPQESR